MNILLLYFSATGNTAYYAELLARSISARGHRCDLMDIEKRFNTAGIWRAEPVIPHYITEAEGRLPLPEKLASAFAAHASADEGPAEGSAASVSSAAGGGLVEKDSLEKAFDNLDRYMSNFDIIGFGSPVYFFEPPAVFSSFIKMLKPFDGRKVFTFATHMEGPVYFAENIRRVLKEKGFDVIGHIDDHIIHTELLPVMPKWLAGESLRRFYLNRRLPKIKRKIRKFLDSLNIVKGAAAESITPAAFHTAPAMDRFAGGLVEKGLYASMKYYTGSRILKEKCVKCGLCARTCPMGLIKMDAETGYPLRTGHCMYCLRCINICPAEAVSYAPLYDNKSRFKGFERLLSGR
jgi:ferredoxin/flavodoxin